MVRYYSKNIKKFHRKFTRRLVKKKLRDAIGECISI